MVAILGYFYGAQDKVLPMKLQCRRAVDNATQWVLSRGYANVLIEINNECDQHYMNAILQPVRVAN